MKGNILIDLRNALNPNNFIDSGLGHINDNITTEYEFKLEEHI